MTDIRGEGFLSELQGDEGDMAGVHGLDGKSFGGDVNVDHFDEVLEGVDDFAEQRTVFQSGFKHMAVNAEL